MLDILEQHHKSSVIRTNYRVIALTDNQETCTRKLHQFPTVRKWFWEQIGFQTLEERRQRLSRW